MFIKTGDDWEGLYLFLLGRILLRLLPISFLHGHDGLVPDVVDSFAFALKLLVGSLALGNVGPVLGEHAIFWYHCFATSGAHVDDSDTLKTAHLELLEVVLLLVGERFPEFIIIVYRYRAVYVSNVDAYVVTVNVYVAKIDSCDVSIMDAPGYSGWESSTSPSAMTSPLSTTKEHLEPMHVCHYIVRCECMHVHVCAMIARQQV